jgi:two-component system, NarL family, sensor kinase
VTIQTSGNVGSLPPATEVTAFRIVMEAVTNASRHGQASECVVHLAVDGALEVRVEDDGRGLAPDHVPGVGLASMCERAAELGGTCSVEPRPGGGTVVRARLPIGAAS